MTERFTADGETVVETKPHFVPIFEIGKPLSQEQLRGLVDYFRNEIFSGSVYSFYAYPDKGIVGISEMTEPGRAIQILIGRCKIPKEPRLSVEQSLDQKRIFNSPLLTHQKMSQLLTFADNALSWGDSVTITPTSNLTLDKSTLEFERSCGHSNKCGLGKKSVARRVLEKISR